ncbi:MAG: YbjN domain-containing protein [Bacteroidota bacterium]
MNILQPFYQSVETAIQEIGIPIEQTRDPQRPGMWHIRKGTANLTIEITFYQPSQRVVMAVWSIMMDIPKNNVERLSQLLLELNTVMMGPSFAYNNGKVLLRSVRDGEGLDAQECKYIILQMGHFADEYDEKLQQDFPHQRPIGFQVGSQQSPESPESQK